MRVVAILAAHNEERFIGGCISRFAAQGVETYLIDDGSKDATVEIARSHEGRGLIGLEQRSRTGVYSWHPILERKEELARELDADWFIHADPDEVRLPPPGHETLVDALAFAEECGANAVNFFEFTFVPTLEDPDHDHPNFMRSMLSYYPFLPWFPHRLNAWKRQERPVDLATSGGHAVAFPGIRMHPVSFPMRHYLFLSRPHAVEKYVRKVYDPAEVKQGWHGSRAWVRPEEIRLPSRAELRYYRGGGELERSAPLLSHPSFPDQT